MVDLARQAFTTKNYDLAAEIYERNIKEYGPTSEGFLGLADSYAKGGQIQRAFQSYSNALRLGKVSSEKLNNLVSALVDMMSEKDLKPKSNTSEKDDIFACGLCKGIWNEPITIPCGHTFCRKCLLKEQSKKCKTCGAVHQHCNFSSLKTNVLLLSTIQKWFAHEIEASKLKAEGNELFASRKFDKAIVVYSKALKYAPKDHLLTSNRSYAYISLGRYKEALLDAEVTVKLRPDWPKGYFRKGTALSGLGKYEDAAFALLQCLTLDSQVASARSALAKALHKVFSPLPASDVKRAELQSVINPSSLTRALFEANDMEQTVLSHQTLNQLKQSLKEKLVEVGALAQNYDPARTTSTLETSAGLCAAFQSSHLEESEIKCKSAPSSPLLNKRIISCKQPRSLSLTQLPHLEKTMRKRTSHEFSNEPRSPSQSKPCKQAKADPKITKNLGTAAREVSQDLLNKEDYECSLCYRLLYSPVTTPCGHVFCKQCLARCLDHSSQCPQCRSSLTEYLAERRQTVTESLDLLVQSYFPQDFIERKKQHEEEIAELAKMGADNQTEIPVFVCTIAYPTVPCPLHVFEPRYRLMIRQCMEAGTRQFGMCVGLNENEDGYSDYGCMLEVRDVQYFPDGRSVVDTVGGRRFKVLSRGMRDGYNTAKVEFLKERKIEEAELPELKKLHDDVYQTAFKWFNEIPSVPKYRILQHFGPFPEREPDVFATLNGPAWSWWMLAVLPLDPRAQLSIIGMTSLKERLFAIQRVLNYVKRKGTK